MRLAIVHYHLRPGGVTRVLQHTESALSDAVRTVILTSEPPASSMPLSSDYAIVEDLKYSASSHFSTEQIGTKMETLATERLGGPPDVWHFHNHSLAKNLVVPEIVYYLAQKGHRLLLHIHDLAEDGRPDNYTLLRGYFGDANTLGAHVYPQASHVHYAFINTKDLKCFQALEETGSALHYLPDPVELEIPQHAEPSQQRDERLFIYPTRAIRRKNVGEFLLLAAMAEEGDRFAVTRAPKNPQHLPIYRDWVRFARSLKLPVDFDAGEHWQGDFTGLLRSADCLVSTSIAEGFGLAFLEPWLAERPLIGRKLPDITNVFEADGVNLSGLYEKLLVPIAWVGKDRFYQDVRTALTRSYEAYGRTARMDDVEKAVEAAITDDSIDFGRLNESLQKVVIQRIAREPSLTHTIVPSPFECADADISLVSHNTQIVRSRYNVQQYSQRLLHIYQAVAGSPVESVKSLDADRLFDQYLAPERFWLLSS